MGVGRWERGYGRKDVTWGNGHMVQCADGVLLRGTVLLASITLINSGKEGREGEKEGGREGEEGRYSHGLLTWKGLKMNCNWMLVRLEEKVLTMGEDGGHMEYFRQQRIVLKTF